jgi:uncharacterized membrane protein YkvA (DUF1232 family)
LGKRFGRLKNEIAVWRHVLKDPGTPKLAKWIVGLAVAYLLSPVDLIPDFIPVVGYLDDVILVPLFLFIAFLLVPKEVLRRSREAAAARQTGIT